ncbi:MAG: hypothetical protein P9G45_15035 [Candidatus Contendobacter sp.]|nr:hypothetical protein [Candidatus Contendobacter sp.]
MNEQRTMIRVAILKALYDIDYGQWPMLMDKQNPSGQQVAYHDDLGTAGTTLSNYIKRLFPFISLSDQQVESDLAYLIEKGFVVRKPTGRIPGSDKVERMKHSWFAINAYGKDVIEGNRQEPTMPEIKQHIVHIGEINGSAVAVNSPEARVTLEINHAQSSELKNLINQLEEAINSLQSENQRNIGNQLINQLKGEISLEKSQQDSTVISSQINRLKNWFQQIDIPAIGKIYEVLEKLMSILALT